MLHSVDKCDVCGKTAPSYVHSSALGPMSFASCTECLQHHAEPTFLFAYMYDCVADQNAPNFGLSPTINSIYTYMDGAYCLWHDWVKWRQDPIRKAELDAVYEQI